MFIQKGKRKEKIPCRINPDVFHMSGEANCGTYKNYIYKINTPNNLDEFPDNYAE